MKPTLLLSAVVMLSCAALSHAAEPARILTNHLGYDSAGPKRAVVRGSAADEISSFTVRTYPGGTLVFQGKTTPGTAVDHWKDWRFWSLDFTGLQNEGAFVIECQDKDQTLRSFPFRIQKDPLGRYTLSDVLFYFKTQDVSGRYQKFDEHLPFRNNHHAPIDARGGWYDASGDYGVHMSHLDFSNYFNPQQAPLVAFSIAKTLELINTRQDVNYRQIKLRLADELDFGADFLVRMKNPQGSFYETKDGYAQDKKAEARTIVPIMSQGFAVRKNQTGEYVQAPKDGTFDVGFRNGGGFAIAALAMAARLDDAASAFGHAAYLKAAEDAFTFLQAHNTELVFDGKENILDDYCALVAAAELYRTTHKAVYAEAAESRAEKLLARQVSDGPYKNYWRADDKDRPFFHAADAGAPVVALVDYYDLAPKALQFRIRDAVKRSLEFELWVTNEVPNPFGYARQYVQNKEGARRTSFFYPHDSETAPWWQGENARLGSLSAAARLAAPLFADDPALQAKLQSYATDQLNWILGLNPFDASMLQGTGRNNPEYTFFNTWQYKSAPGGICNGITGGFFDEDDIDLSVPFELTKQDADWRWAEQWIPHAAWYLLAVAAAPTPASVPEKAVIGYVFTRGEVVKPAEIAAEKLTHINYAFANIKDGLMVEGFEHDAENFKLLNGLKARNPKLKVMISVGGWTWSGNFSDMALTPASRKRFITSAVAFLERYKLDGLDIDWEFPGQKGLDNVHRPEDKENLTALVAELRAALGDHYLLTMATQAADVWLEHTEMGKVQKYLNFINLMAYDDYEAGSDPITGHHAPLYTNPADPKGLSAALVIGHYIAAGVPANKLVLGVPFYGHAWGEVPATANGLFQSGKEPKLHMYASFKGIKEKLENQDGFVRYWDEASAVPYLYSAAKQIFVSYEDEQSVRGKSWFVADHGLGGVMFWDYSGDKDTKLLTAINEVLRPQP